MAVTSLWRIKGNLGKVVRYTENPSKVSNPNYPGNQAVMPIQGQEQGQEQEQWLAKVIDYAIRSNKTQCADERIEIMQKFVSGINCMPETARDEMTATKTKFSKSGGVIAYHGYQSFAPGEATPEMAHEIGVKLAERLWGDRHEVIVATHLDKKNHLHSHFVLNTVSFVDGKKFYRSKSDYYNMQRVSDALCREYGLSVIENPKRGKTMQFAEWQAERKGHTTWRGMVKSDVDTAVRQSMTESQFFANLRNMGYEIKPGKDLSVRPPGKERFVRLYRNFGEDYSIESIRRRILAQTRPERRIISSGSPPRKILFIGSIHMVRRNTGLRALYFYYLYRMGALPNKRQPNQSRVPGEPNPRQSGKQVYFLFREDIRFIQSITRETRLLAKHGIDTAGQLASYKAGLIDQIGGLNDQRKQLYKQVRNLQKNTKPQRPNIGAVVSGTANLAAAKGDKEPPPSASADAIGNTKKLAAVKAEIATVSKNIGELRREVKLCEDIETRSGVMRDKIRKAKSEKLEEKSQRKERTSYEQFRRRR